jgi:hypothetical protein
MLGQQVQPQVPPLEVKVHRLEVSYHWALAIAIVAIVALAGLLAWNAYGSLTLPDGKQVTADLAAAWNSGDPASLEDIYAEDAVLVSAGGEAYEGLAAIKGIGVTLASYDFTVETIGPVTQNGNTIAVPYHQTWSTGEEAWVTTILEMNSAGLVVHHQDYGKP